MPLTVFDFDDLPAELQPEADESFGAWVTRVATYNSANPGTLTPVNASNLEAMQTAIGVYVDAQVAAAVASASSALTAHTTDASAAHAASAISVSAIDGETWDDVQEALQGIKDLADAGGSGGSGHPTSITATKTTTYTAAAGEFVPCNATSAGFTVTLPTGPATGAKVTVKKIDGTANVVTVAPAGGGTIDGDANATITSPDFGATFIHTGSNVWLIESPTSSGGSNGTDGADGAPGSTGPSGADGQTTVTANTRTADYTLVLGDAGKSIETNHATNAIVITIPPNASVAFPVGTVIEVCRYGAGVATIAPGSGVTIPNRVQVAGTANRTIANQLGAASLRQRATNEWVLVGDIA